MTREFTTLDALSLVLIKLLNVVLGVVVLRTNTKADIRPLSPFFTGIALWAIPQGSPRRNGSTVGFVLAKTVDSSAVIMSTAVSLRTLER